MTINPLPPQAYTKQTLVKAYEWLKTQSESIRQIATSPDVLVSLYMKAQMQGEDVLHRPSIQNFKKDLKDLASIMGEWDQVSSSVDQVMRVGVGTGVGSSNSNSNSIGTGVSDYGLSPMRSSLGSEPPAMALGGRHQEAPKVAPEEVFAKASASVPKAASIPAPEIPERITGQIPPQVTAPPAHQATMPIEASFALEQVLDERSIALLVQVKNEYNLSSNHEALRFLITLGAKKALSI